LIVSNDSAWELIWGIKTGDIPGCVPSVIWDINSLINSHDTGNRARIAFKFFFFSPMKIAVERENKLRSWEGHKLSLDFIKRILEIDQRSEETDNFRLSGIRIFHNYSKCRIVECGENDLRDHRPIFLIIRYQNYGVYLNRWEIGSLFSDIFVVLLVVISWIN
jgi:hypothetical protein